MQHSSDISDISSDTRSSRPSAQELRAQVDRLGQEVQRQATDIRSLSLARTVQALTPDQRAMLMVSLPALRALADQVNPA